MDPLDAVTVVSQELAFLAMMGAAPATPSDGAARGRRVEDPELLRLLDDMDTAQVRRAPPRLVPRCAWPALVRRGAQLHNQNSLSRWYRATHTWIFSLSAFLQLEEKFGTKFLLSTAV